MKRTKLPSNSENTRYISLENGEHVMIRRVPGYEDLWVNVDGTVVIDRGTVRRIYLLSGGTKKRKPYMMAFVEGRSRYVHHLVASAFWAPSKQRYVLHLDGNKLNNHYKNLVWGNSLDKHYNQVSNGLYKLKEFTNQNSKIPLSDHPQIIERLKNGETLRKIALEYHTSDMSVHRLKMKYITSIEPPKKKNLKNRTA